MVLGEWRGAGEKAPTVLVYGHYDVQPAEPLDLWTTPPFEPVIRDGRIYARGSVDDKGQLFLHIKAIQAHLTARGKLPVNMILLAEGEEEVGSENLEKFIEKHAERLACDYVVISDSSMFAPGLPSILSSLRGLAYFQIDVQGAEGDLHSGSYGGAVGNPATALARIIASFHDADGHIAIAGFYDKVRAWDAASREALRKLPFSEKTFLEEATAPSAVGEKGYSTLERVWSRPTCEVNGLLSGYTGEGAKTVLPGEGDGEGELPPGARSVAHRDRAVDEGAHQARDPAGRERERAAFARRPPVARGIERSTLRRRAPRAQDGVREESR